MRSHVIDVPAKCILATGQTLCLVPCLSFRVNCHHGDKWRMVLRMRGVRFTSFAMNSGTRPDSPNSIILGPNFCSTWVGIRQVNGSPLGRLAALVHCVPSSMDARHCTMIFRLTLSNTALIRETTCVDEFSQHLFVKP